MCSAHIYLFSFRRYMYLYRYLLFKYLFIYCLHVCMYTCIVFLLKYRVRSTEGTINLCERVVVVVGCWLLAIPRSLNPHVP